MSANNGAANQNSYPVPYTKLVSSHSTFAHSGPTVSTITVAQLDVSNLYLTTIDPEGLDPTPCIVHDHCTGHMTSDDSQRIGMPSYRYLSESRFVSQLAKDTKQFYRGLMSSEDYSGTLIRYMSGKTGMLRKGLMSCTPSTSVRGVAIPCWTDVDIVWIPNAIWCRMRLTVYEDKYGTLIDYPTPQLVRTCD
jgi:hypothetical protein